MSLKSWIRESKQVPAIVLTLLRTINKEQFEALNSQYNFDDAFYQALDDERLTNQKYWSQENTAPDLPNELLYEIVKNSTVADIDKLCLVNQQMNSLCDDWRRVVMVQYPEAVSYLQENGDFRQHLLNVENQTGIAFDLVQYLNGKVVDVNQMFIKAVMENEKKVVDLLLQDERTDPSFENNRALMFAIENDDQEVIKSIVQSPRFDPFQVQEFQLNEIFDAVLLYGSDELIQLMSYDSNVSLTPEIVKDLIARGITFPSDYIFGAIDSEDIEYIELMASAIIFNDEINEKISRLVAPELYETGERAEVREFLLTLKQFKPSRQLLLDAVMIGDVRTVELILQKGTLTPRVTDLIPAIQQPSFEAYDFEEYFPEVVELYLADKRFNPTAFDNLLFFTAIQERFEQVIDVLLNDERLSPTSMRDGKTMLEIASLLGDEDVIEQLNSF